MQKNAHKYYETPVIIDTPIGNNAFSFVARKQLGSACQLRIPTIKIVQYETVSGSFNGIKLWREVVFEEVDEKGKLHSCSGLDAIYEIQKINKAPIFLMDNHNHALYLWALAFKKLRQGAWASLIHIDQHADMGNPWTPIDKSICDISSKIFDTEQLDYIARYTNEVCNVGNFIQPALDCWLVQKVTQVRSVAKLIETGLRAKESDKMSTPLKASETGKAMVAKNTNWILDIDIDFWVDHEPSDQELHALKILYQNCKVCTIALSPYFINIKKSSQIAKRIINFCLWD